MADQSSEYDDTPEGCCDRNWFREEYERAKARNAQIPPHARMVVTNPVLSAHRPNRPRFQKPRR